MKFMKPPLANLKISNIEKILFELSNIDVIKNRNALSERHTESLQNQMIREIPRIAFQLKILANTLPSGATIVDVGGGVNLFGLGAIELGFNFILIDDFSDGWHESAGEFIDFEAKKGVQIINTDIRSKQLPFPPKSVDAFTSFDCLEHLPFSPKPLLKQMLGALKPGGLMFIGVPNCVNLRKRISVPMGFGKWSDMKEWYEEPEFRGHVREPDVDDLRYIARDLRLTNVKIIGRNWIGYYSRHKWARLGTPIADKLLQLRPSLCSNIYLLGTARDIDN